MFDNPPLLADGFELAFIGCTQTIANGYLPVEVYDRQKCIEILVERDGMTREEAEEFFEFNTAGAYVGPQTPLFIVLCDIEDLSE